MESYQTMESFKIEKENGSFKLKLKNIEIPKPNEDQVLIKVNATSLNFRDNMVIRGDFGEKVDGITPVSDVVGTIVQIGSKVSSKRNDSLKIGDRVTANFCTDWVNSGRSVSGYQNTLGYPINGGLAEYMIIPGEAVVVPPSYLSDEEVSTLPIAALTAYQALIVKGGLEKDQYVLIQGTGGVSIFGIQIANAIGAKTIVLTGSEEKAVKVKQLGAAHVINYKTHPNWHEKVLELTNGEGVDITLEVVGNLNQSIDATKREGNIIVIGILESLTTNLDLIRVIGKRINIHGILVGSKFSFDEMNNLFTQHQIKPVIEQVYKFHDSEAAYQHLQRGAFGKIVIKINNSN